jgi:hypothetical protein
MRINVMSLEFQLRHKFVEECVAEFVCNSESVATERATTIDSDLKSGVKLISEWANRSVAIQVGNTIHLDNLPASEKTLHRLYCGSAALSSRKTLDEPNHCEFRFGADSVGTLGKPLYESGATITRRAVFRQFAPHFASAAGNVCPNQTHSSAMVSTAETMQHRLRELFQTDTLHAIHLSPQRRSRLEPLDGHESTRAKTVYSRPKPGPIPVIRK